MLRGKSRRFKWFVGVSVALLVGLAGLLIAASVIAQRFDPYIREQAIQYLKNRFDSEVELESLQIRIPTIGPLRLLLSKGQGTIVRIEGKKLSLRHRGRTDIPPLFILNTFTAHADLGNLFADIKNVDEVTLDGMEINLPPKGERPDLRASGGAARPDEDSSSVNIGTVLIHDAKLILHPRDKKKVPLQFDLQDIRLDSEGKDAPMKYVAVLKNAKPPGLIHSTGTFGPWVSGEPGDTPLTGNYLFEDADLGVFNGIAGTLKSTGDFQGTLSSITAKGEATVPDFRLKRSNNRISLQTRFEVLVDGTNGNTELKPVVARLGNTNFRTSGIVVKHEGDTHRTISLRVSMPKGDLRDVLRLAMPGSPFMEGTLNLDTSIDIPPLSGKVHEKLLLDGKFEVSNGKFLKSTIQDQIDGLSRRGQGKPTNQEIDEVVSRMSGKFHLEDEAIGFEALAFAVQGAVVNISGMYNIGEDNLNFHGALMLDAKVSQTMSGWKRWVLKPIDPIFAKNGAGTYLKIKVVGTSKQPKFGLDR